MSKLIYTSLVMLGLAACSSGDAKESNAAGDAAATTVLRQRTLGSGTRIDATVRHEVSSRTDTAGQTMEVVVASDVTDQSGIVVIPAGSSALLNIVALKPAQDRGDDGQLSLATVSISIAGTAFPLMATMEPVKYALVGRGLTAAEAARDAKRDVVVAAGTPVALTLTQSFSVFAK